MVNNTEGLAGFVSGCILKPYRTAFYSPAGGNKIGGQDHLVAVIDSRLNTTLLEYDKNHNLTKVIGNDLNETINTYDSHNRIS